MLCSFHGFIAGEMAENPGLCVDLRVDLLDKGRTSRKFLGVPWLSESHWSRSLVLVMAKNGCRY